MFSRASLGPTVVPFPQASCNLVGAGLARERHDLFFQAEYQLELMTRGCTLLPRTVRTTGKR
jgi:hypothetical protein